MNRETKKLNTPIGNNAVEILTYITGKEMRILQDALEEERKGKAHSFEDATFKTLIVSIDGKTQKDLDIVDFILNQRRDDVDFLRDQIGDIIKTNEEKKTK